MILRRTVTLLVPLAAGLSLAPPVVLGATPGQLPFSTAGMAATTLTAQATDHGDGTLVLMLAGLAGVAAVALLGAGWLLAARRKRADEEQANREPPTDPGSSRESARSTGATQPRARHRAGLHPGADPILASMGLTEPDDELTPPERRRARGVSSRRGPARRD